MYFHTYLDTTVNPPEIDIDSASKAWSKGLPIGRYSQRLKTPPT